jgi:hypothetical protein
MIPFRVGACELESVRGARRPSTADLDIGTLRITENGVFEVAIQRRRRRVAQLRRG